MRRLGCLNVLCTIPLAALFCSTAAPVSGFVAIVDALQPPDRLSFDLPPKPFRVSRPPSLNRLEQWLAAVDRHVSGAQDDALRAATAWNRDDVREILFHLPSVAALVRDPRANVNFKDAQNTRTRIQALYTASELRRLQELALPWESRGERSLLMRAAWLHTDAALLGGVEDSRRERRADTLSDQIFVLDSNDGRQVGTREIAGHLEAARAALSGIRPDPKIDPKTDRALRLWYRATAAYLQREARQDSTHVETAVERFPRDPDLLFLAGTLHETFATPRMQQVVASAKLPDGMTLGIASARAELERAERLFHQALRANPRLTEARIRLGNVLGLLGRHTDAAIELRQAIPAVGDEPLLKYYGGMFLAREAEQLGDVAQARALYENAARFYPHAQSPFIALSQLAQREGDSAGARRAFERVVDAARTADQGTDPWWQYATQAGRAADTLLADARKALVSERRP